MIPMYKPHIYVFRLPGPLERHKLIADIIHRWLTIVQLLVVIGGMVALHVGL